MKEDMQEVREQLDEIARYSSALSLLGWDKEVNMPKSATPIRGEVNALIATEAHKRAISPEFVDKVKRLADVAMSHSLTNDEKIIVREVWRDIEKAVKIPVEFVVKFTKLTTEANTVWDEARQKSDFSLYEPLLEQIVEMSREKAELLGYDKSPYDALLDGYEPEMTSEKLVNLFTPLASQLATLIADRDKESAKPLPEMTYDIADQKALGTKVAGDLGFDFEAGRLDISPHPFTVGIHPTDVRITTRYNVENFYDSLGSTIHEVGHGLYEQGLPSSEFGNPLGEASSLGVHESQSRIWENFIGRSKAFVGYLYPLMRDQFGKLPYSEDELHRWLNRVEPSLIRVEADEMTYNLHIILRFELEKVLIENKLKVSDLPEAWNQKMKEYLGVDVPDDAKGVLQDVHWSYGSIGYFPTYTLGNIYAAQLYNKIAEDIPDLERQVSEGEFEPFLTWLRKNIHQYGRRFIPDDLIRRASGSDIDSSHLIMHLKQKI